MDNMASPDWEFQDVSVGSSKLTSLTCSPYILEESVCSNSPILDEQAAKKARICESFDNPILYGNGEFPYADISGSFSNEFSSLNKHTCCGECGLMLFKIHEVFVHVDPGLFMSGGILSVECLKDEVACLCYLQLPAEKRSQELFPLIQDMRCGERVLDNFEEVTNFEGHLCGKGWIDVSASGCIQKRLMKIYVDCCIDLSESPNLNILKKLYNLEFREDEVFVSDCELDDASITALLNALEIQKTFGILNLSHNSLGKGTVEKLQKVFASCQKWDCFVLDLHQNILGPDSLYQISEFAMLFSRLGVLDVSGNCLTDECANSLCSILENFKALYSFSVERCSITSLTIEKIADALHSDSVLEHIAIGYNNVSAYAMVALLEKLRTLKRFSELNLSGLKLDMSVVNSLCQLTKTMCFSKLILRDTSLGTEGALQITQSFDANYELIKLDLQSCQLRSQFIVNMNAEISLINSLHELNLGGNPIGQEGGSVISSLLKNPEFSLKVLILNNSRLGLSGVAQILQALSGNCWLQELNLAQNANREDAEINILGLGDSKISIAIGKAERLKLLDLSDNMLSKETVEVLYAGWLACSREAGLVPQRHIQENIIHFSVQGRKCCGFKPCCRNTY